MKKFELYDELNQLSNRGEILEITNPTYLTCKRLFSELRMGEKFDSTNPGRMLDILYGFESISGNSSKVTQALSEIELDLNPDVNAASDKMGSKSLRSDQLKVLLDKVDEKRNRKEIEAIADEVTRERLLKNVDRSTVVATLIKKFELQAKLESQGKPSLDADRLSDQILETAQVVTVIAVDEEFLGKRSIEMAEEIVELSEKARSTAEAVQLAEAMEIETHIKDADDMLRYLVETNRANRVLAIKIDEIANDVVTEIEVAGGSLGTRKEEVIELIAKRYERLLQHPEHKINDARYETRSVNGKVEMVVVERGLADEIIHTLKGGSIRTIPGRQEQVIEVVVENKLGALTTPLTEVTNASTGNAVKMMMEKLTSNGFGASDLKALMRLRTGAVEPGIVGIEKGLSQERNTKVEMMRQGAPADKVAEVETTRVVIGMLNGDEPIQDVVLRIELYREKLAGSNQQHSRHLESGEVRVISREPYQPIIEMEAVVKVADRLKDRPDLQGRMEVIRRIEKAKNFIDKYTGGLISKTFGSSSIQIGRIMKIEGLQQFGMQLANRYGGVMGEAMASQIIHFGFEKGLQNILVQLFRTGTIKAVEVGVTTAAAGTAAAGTAVTGAALAAGGPPTWVVAAVMAMVTIAKQAFKTGEKVLVRVLETLGIGSAKNVADVKKFVSDMVKMGMVAGGVVVTTILSIPTMLAAAPMGMVGIVLVIVLSSLIGYNLLQTATTQISSQVSPKVDDGGGVCVKKSDIKGPAGGKLANCDTSKTASVPGISQDAFVNLAERWSAGGGTNAARCYGSVVCAAISAGKDPAYVLWAWLHESGASNYGLGQIEDFGVHGQGPATNDFGAQMGSFLKLDPGYCNKQNGMDYWLGFATNYLTGTCDPNVAIGSNTGYTYLAEMEQTWSWVSGKSMPATANGSGGASCGGGGSSNSEDEEDGETEIDPNTGEEYTCFGGGTLVSGSGAGFPRGTGSPSRGPSSPYPTRDPNIIVPPGCPMGWPVDGNMPITQGSRGDHTHTNIPGIALDIMPTDAKGNGSIGGTSIKTTHPGVVIYSGYSGGAYGNLVIVRGKCGNSNFVTYYAHLMDSQLVSMNQTMTAGQSVGLADNSGDYPVGNDHLHYEIRGCAAETGGCYGASGFDPHDYIPVDVPDGCFWNCNVNTGKS